MADAFFQLDLATTIGDRVDAEQLVVSGQTVKRERDQIAGRLDVEIAEVKNAAPGSTLYGLVVRNIPSGIQATSLNGIVDGNNSTSTPLGGSGVFTGVATEIKDYVVVTVFVFSSVASAVNGLAVQFSTDGVNWDHQHLHSVSAGIAHSFAIKSQARYYRIVYTNGGSAQSSFRLQAILNPASSSGTVQPVGEVPVDSDDALMTQSVIVGRTTAGGGAYVPVKVNPSGALTVAASQDTTPWVISTAQLPAALVGARLDINAGAWLGSTAPTVGQKTAANSIPVVWASDQTGSPQPTAPTTTSKATVADSTSPVTLRAANAARKGLTIANAVTLSPLYILFGAGTVSATNWDYIIQAGQSYEMPPSYDSSIVTGVWLAAGSGNAVVTERT